MVVEEKLKSNYKLFLITIKYLPYSIAIIEAVNSISSFFGLELIILSYIGGISFLTILFMLLTSFTFKFCTYHRLPIYYVIITNSINIYDYYIGIPIENENLLLIHSFLIVLTIVLFSYLHIKKI